MSLTCKLCESVTDRDSVLLSVRLPLTRDQLCSLLTSTLSDIDFVICSSDERVCSSCYNLFLSLDEFKHRVSSCEAAICSVYQQRNTANDDDDDAAVKIECEVDLREDDDEEDVKKPVKRTRAPRKQKTTAPVKSPAKGKEAHVVSKRGKRKPATEQQQPPAVAGAKRKRAPRTRDRTQKFDPTLVGPQICEECGIQVATVKVLRLHWRTVHGDMGQSQCDVCNVEFHSKVLLETHKRREHSVEEGDFVCEECGKAFNDEHGLSIHQRVVHIGERMFVCSECPEKFRYRGVLLSHLIKEHGIDRRLELPCNMCDKKFVGCGKVQSMAFHMWTVHQVRVPALKLFTCPTCGKEFYYKSRLQIHQRLHTGEKPFTCPVCAKSFRLGSKMLKHVRRMHKKSADEGDKSQTKSSSKDAVNELNTAGTLVAGVKNELEDKPK
ncbi:unnamed protein product [Notodromas monacha]|uniref:C2H2-type domain-containing protein n=1 Tax=Notodromas monacha TaxID=399045 RepID=A0A7R9G9C6_9CRUS|nr:unnamed protein product [Notodromas monacha]CAG0914077.1 unnamed protein product [Notodromas monacha]